MADPFAHFLFGCKRTVVVPCAFSLCEDRKSTMAVFSLKPEHMSEVSSTYNIPVIDCTHIRELFAGLKHAFDSCVPPPVSKNKSARFVLHFWQNQTIRRITQSRQRSKKIQPPFYRFCFFEEPKSENLLENYCCQNDILKQSAIQ